MPWWKRWPNRVRLALTGLKYRLARLLHRAGLLPSTRRASTDTMGDWKRLQAMADDPQPRLVRPPDGPYADLIRRVRLYAQNGAKALAPLLDSPLPIVALPDDIEPDGDGEQVDWDAERHRLVEMHGAAHDAQDHEAEALIGMFLGSQQDGLLAVTDIERVRAAYNAPWTVVDGEVFEVVTEKAKEEAQ